MSYSAPAMLLQRNIAAGLALAALLVVGAPMSASAAEPAYLGEVDDMPLPAGFVEDRQAGMVFDKPEGRIVDAVARGSGARADIVAFYREALPGLGWNAEGSAGELRWHRDGEALRIEIAGSGATVTVRFHIAPR
jgi:hypothetical protein